MSDLVTLATTSLADRLFGWFAETTLVAAALAALVSLATRVRWLTPGPAARHTLWLLVVLKLMTPPLIVWPWSLPAPVALARAADLVDRGGVEVRMVEPALGVEPGRDPATLAAPPTPRGDAVAAIPHNWPEPHPPRGVRFWVVLGWIGGSIGLAIHQTWRVVRFRRTVLEAKPAPGWLVAAAAQVGRRLGVRVPPILVVPGLGTPVLWCLGRPVLLVPGPLLKTLEAGRWRSIVAHELAHLRRGDHWVRRLELVAGFFWWWNPLFWVVRSRLDFEAELACDAWAVWAMPADRLTYAESLLRICTGLSPASPPASALGVAGTGHSFERRLTMILRDRVERRVCRPALLAAGVLAALAIPSWTWTESAQAEAAPLVSQPVALDPTTWDVGGDDDDDQKAKAKDDDEAREASARDQAAQVKADQERLRKTLGDLDQQMREKFGPESDFTRKMAAIGKEMEAKFGPGSEFVKQMEAIGKEMEAKFGPGSDFARELEKNFGTESGFAEKMIELLKDDDAGDGKLDAEKLKLKLKAEHDKRTAEARAEKARHEASRAKVKAQGDAEKAKGKAAKDKANKRGKAKSTPDDQARRIEALESQIDAMKAELTKLKAKPEADDDQDDQD